MGEKPVSINEAPQPVALAGPLGGSDLPPGTAAGASISTTRSNIKTQGVAAPEATDVGEGTGWAANEAPGTEHIPSEAGIAIKEQGLFDPKKGGSSPMAAKPKPTPSSPNPIITANPSNTANPTN